MRLSLQAGLLHNSQTPEDGSQGGQNTPVHRVNRTRVRGVGQLRYARLVACDPFARILANQFGGKKLDTTALLVSKRDAAQMLAVSVRTIDNLLAARELPSRRVGRRVLIPRRALEQFVRKDHGTKKVSDASTGKVAGAWGAR